MVFVIFVVAPNFSHFVDFLRIVRVKFEFMCFLSIFGFLRFIDGRLNQMNIRIEIAKKKLVFFVYKDVCIRIESSLEIQMKS